MRGKIIVLFTALLLTACASYDEEQTVRRERMPVILSIPAAGSGEQTRAPGDPGNYERFELPKYLWLYMVEENGTAAKVVESKSMELDANWTKEKLGTDSIYTYSGELTMDLLSGRTGTARIYALLSSVQLTDMTVITDNTSTEENLLDLKFSLPTTLPTGYNHLGDVIRNIYSSPYNLMRNGNYYGTVQDYTTESPYVENFILYHVGAKLDVIWNVDETKQGSVCLNKLKVTNLQKTNCMAFKPLENNEVPGSGSTYDESFTIDIGAQWYGRHSFYIIPYNNNDNNYPANLSLYKTGNDTETADKTVTIQAEYKTGTPADDIYTPWIVAPLRITTDLTTP